MKRATYADLAAWRARSLPLRQRSLRKSEADAVYTVNRQQRFVQARGQCEFKAGGLRCLEGAAETHHVRRRSNSGLPDHSTGNLRALCAEHHRYIHEHVAWAHEKRWIVAEWPQLEAR